MSIRTVSYLLSGENDSPLTPQYGGVRYEDNATSVVFTLEENYKLNIENAYQGTELVYRIDFNSRNAGYNPSENLVLTDNTVSRTIPLCMTFYGEQITATLVITAIDNDGNAVGTVLSPEIKIYFDDVAKDEPYDSVIGENISAAEKRAEEFCVLAEKHMGLAEGFADIAADNAAFSQAAADNAADSAAIAKSAEQNIEAVVENHKSDVLAHSALFEGKVDKADGMGLSSNDYTLAEKQKLALIENGAQVNIAPDQTYLPTSENAQSGKAVAGAIQAAKSYWKKIVNITTTEEVNGIISTTEEFPDLSKCKEFIIRAEFPKSTTGEKISLGSAKIDFNNGVQVGFRFNSINLDPTGICEVRCHILIAARLLHSVGTYQATGVPSVTGSMHTLVGERNIDAIKNINFLMSNSANFLPVGTKFAIFGRVEN